MNSLSNSTVEDFTSTNKKSSNSNSCQFALCESCFWSATLLDLPQEKSINNLYICPVCPNKNISLIPLAKDEIYELSLTPKGGLDMTFSKSNHRHVSLTPVFN